MYIHCMRFLAATLVVRKRRQNVCGFAEFRPSSYHIYESHTGHDFLLFFFNEF